MTHTAVWLPASLAVIIRGFAKRRKQMIDLSVGEDEWQNRFVISTATLESYIPCY